MRSWFLIISIVSLAAILPFLPSQSQEQKKSGDLKIGVVDIRKIFDSFERTADARKRIQEMRDGFTNERKVYIEGLRKIGDDLNSLREDIQNKTISEEEREKKKEAYLQKMQDFQLRERELRQFDMDREKIYQDARQRMQDDILKEISREIESKAKAEGYTLILDKSGLTTTGMSALPFAQDSLDITADIIKALNSPANVKAPAEKKADKAPKGP